MKSTLLVLVSLMTFSAFAAEDSVLVDEHLFANNYFIKKVDHAAASCGGMVDGIKREYNRNIFNNDALLVTNTSEALHPVSSLTLQRYPNDFSAVGTGLYVSKSAARPLLNRMNFEQNCNSVEVTLSPRHSKTSEYHVKINAVATCNKRSFKQKIALRMAKECELQPTADCFRDDIVALVESAKEMQLQYNIPTDLCSAKSLKGK